MPTLLIKNVPEELLRELRRLKVELECRTWAELLEKLVKRGRGGLLTLSSQEERAMKEAVGEFLKLRKIVSRKWSGPSVLEEFRKARRHEG